VVFDPYQINGGVTPERLRAAKIILWKGPLLRPPALFARARGQCSREVSGIQVIVHPECRWEVCQKADALGSTERLIQLVSEAPEGSIVCHR